MRVLFLSVRNLGDALIARGALVRLIGSLPGVRFVVWCRPEQAVLFSGLPAVEQCVTNYFPVGSKRRFGLRACYGLMANLKRLRSQRFDLSMDLLGDRREFALARLAGSRKHAAPAWPAGHAVTCLTRPVQSGRLGIAVDIPSQCVNMYEAARHFVDSLAPRVGGVVDAGRAADRSHVQRRFARVGLHPGATHPSKQWPLDCWRELCGKLAEEGRQVLIFGAPDERGSLIREFGDRVVHGDIVTVGLPRFLEELAGVDVLIGLDSFSIHAAHHVGVPAIMLAGGSDERIWLPPGACSVTGTEPCTRRPCSGRAYCRWQPDPYVCMRSIRVDSVLACLHGMEDGALP